MIRLLLIVIMLLPAATQFMAGAQQIRSYTIENGLVNNDILSIYQDSRGFIWFCTRGGLSRYDGSRFTNFTTDNGLINDMVNDIVETSSQEFIVAQNIGGPMLLKNDRLIPLGSSKTTLNRFYRFNKDRLVATTDFNGVVTWENDGPQLLDPAYLNSTEKIARLNDSLWMVLDQSLYVQLFTPMMQARSEKLAPGATAVYVDSRNRAWIGTMHGLKLLNPSMQNGKQPGFLPLPAAFNLPMLSRVYITDILEDSQGSYWIGTINGLVHITKEGETTVYAQQDGLPTSFVNCIKEDRQQNIWIGTPMGLAKLPLQKKINTVMVDLGDSHEGWMAALPVTKKKVRVFDGKGIGDLDLVTGKSSNRVIINAAGYPINRLSPNEMMIRKGAEATLFRVGREETETISWVPRDFGCIIRTGQRQFIAAHYDTIYSIKNGRYKELLVMGTKSYALHLILDKKKYLWAGCFADGLMKIGIDEKHDSIQLTIIDTLVGRLPDPHIRTMYADTENELWIGTRYKGVIRLIESAPGKYEIQQYGTSQGLSSDFVLAINRDAAGNIWVGSAQGIDKLIPVGNEYRVFNFGRINKVFQKISAIHFPDTNQVLAIGYPAIMLAKDLKQDAMPPLPVYITRVSEKPADSALYNEAATLPYNKAQIYFEFSAPQFVNEDFARYSYRLLGSNDPGWNIAGNSRSVYFASLRPGRYSFQVRTLGFNGHWGIPAVYEFRVDAPFWQKTWFIMLVVAVTGLLVYALYRYRVQQLIRLQKMRNRIATDLHDEIGSNLTNISILSNLSKKNILQPQKAGDFLQRISEEVSSSSQALDDIIWSVDANHDTLEETVARMRRYAAELFDSANISYELYLDPAFEGRRLSMEQRRDIYLLYKEAVNNISKHAAAKHVAIQIAIESNQLLLSVKDDGRGFDTNSESNRYGLKGMKQRVKKWKGKINIESEKGRGTFIQVGLPVSK